MAYKVSYKKNGKTKSFTYITPQERVEKYMSEIKHGIKLNVDGKPIVTKGYMPIKLTKSQINYRKDYISLYNSVNKNNVSDIAKKNFHRDFQTYMKFKDI